MLKYFRFKARRNVKPELLVNHHFVIKYRASGESYYFNGIGFIDNIFCSSEFCDIESLKTDLVVARRIYACTKAHQLNNLIKETRQFIKEYKQIKNL